MRSFDRQSILNRNAQTVEEFIEPTPASRRKIAAQFVSALVVCVVTLEFLMPRFLEFIHALPLCEQLDWIDGAFLVLTGALMLLAARGIFTARQALRLGQWPLPGAAVLRRTPVQRGALLRRGAYAGLVASLAVIVLGLGAEYLMHQYFTEVQAKRCSVAGTPPSVATPARP
jgi:hypothetical protein